MKLYNSVFVLIVALTSISVFAAASSARKPAGQFEAN
jgi:hypothetical protein